MVQPSATASVQRAAELSRRQVTALVRQSVQDITEIAQTPVAKGGRMRVDTGFLRASGQMSLNGFPQGPIRPGATDWKASTALATLAEFDLGRPIFFAWSASYAAARENKDGFLEAALQQWDEINEKNARRLLR